VDNACLFQKFIRAADWNRQVRAAKIMENGEVHANYLAVAVEEWPGGTARGCRRIVNNLAL
jgi:hypothetical protein